MQVIHKLRGNIRELAFSIASISLVVLTILVFYWQDLSILVNEALRARNEATSHILLVPILVAFLLYRKKDFAKASFALEKLKGKPELISFNEITGIALCLSAFLLYWYGSYTFYPLEYHIASLVLFSAGIILTLFNLKTLLALLFPILFLIFLIPPPYTITSSVGTLLGSVNAQASYALLKTVGMPVTLTWEYGPPTLLLNVSSGQPLQFSVDQACSGIYSIVAFIMFATFLVYILRGSITKRTVLIPLGFLMLPILNIIRISIIVLIAHQLGEQVAMTIFHTFSGWALFSIGMVLILIIAERLLHLQISKRGEDIESCPNCASISKNYEVFCASCGRFLKNRQVKLNKRFWVKITALLLISYVAMLSLQAPVFAFAQGLTLTNSNPEAGVNVFPQAYDYNLTFVYRDEKFERISGQDASLLYVYTSQNVSKPTIYVLVGVSSSIGNLHGWEGCLVGWPIAQGYAPIVNVLDSRDVLIMENPPITAEYFVFQYPSHYRMWANYTQVTLYWFQRVLFKAGPTVESKYTRVNLFIMTRNRSDYPRLEQTLLNMGRSVAAYWEPLKSQTLISLGIPAMQVSLVSTVIFAAIIQITGYTNEWRKKTTRLKIFERLGSPEEKLLYQTIRKLGQETKDTTTQNIVSTFEKETDNTGKSYTSVDLLNSLQKNRIIKADIVTIHDQPTHIWKP